jgi:hypothetical protein
MHSSSAGASSCASSAALGSLSNSPFRTVNSLGVLALLGEKKGCTRAQRRCSAGTDRCSAGCVGGGPRLPARSHPPFPPRWWSLEAAGQTRAEQQVCVLLLLLMEACHPPRFHHPQTLGAATLGFSPSWPRGSAELRRSWGATHGCSWLALKGVIVSAKLYRKQGSKSSLLWRNSSLVLGSAAGCTAQRSTLIRGLSCLDLRPFRTFQVSLQYQSPY